jgi:uncharacterized protein (DUF39 family)/CBS domain-containing protein
MKTYEQINEKIKNGDAVVVTAEEMIGIVEERGVTYAAKEIDVVTTGTFGAMCSSGAFLNFGHSDPPIKMEHLWLNDVHAYHGNAAVDCYLGVTRMASPRNFEYGGGHVLEDFVKGKKVHLSATAYGTDCYPRTSLDLDITLADLNQAILCNPRNAYQRYVCAVNTSNRTLYTYMGKLLPNMGNATFSGAGQLAPIPNDPNFEVMGVGTHIFLCGGDGIITSEGTQHNPTKQFGTLMVQGDLKKMDPEFLAGASFKGYGTSLFVGLGVPIPILNEKIAQNCAIRDDQLVTQVYDYSVGRRDRPMLRSVTYAELRSGKIEINGQEIRVSSMSSQPKARKVAETLKSWIQKGQFFLYPAVEKISTTRVQKSMPDTGTITFVKMFQKTAIIAKKDTSVNDVAKLILEKNDNHVVVVDDTNKLVGFLTTFDLAKSLAGKGTTIKDIMIPRSRVQTVRETDPTDVAIRLMKQFNISSLPVIASDETVLGIIAAEDLIRAEQYPGRG